MEPVWKLGWVMRRNILYQFVGQLSTAVLHLNKKDAARSLAEELKMDTASRRSHKSTSCLGRTHMGRRQNVGWRSLPLFAPEPAGSFCSRSRHFRTKMRRSRESR